MRTFSSIAIGTILWILVVRSLVGNPDIVTTGWDWTKFFYPAVQQIAQGESPYSVPGTFHPYTTLLLLSPLAALPLNLSYLAMIALTVVSVTFALLVFAEEETPLAGISIGFSVLYGILIWLGQITSLEILGMALGMLSLRHSWTMPLSGVLLASIPPNNYPALLWLMYEHFRRNPLVSIVTAVCIGAYGLLTFAIGGWWIADIQGGAATVKWNIAIWNHSVLAGVLLAICTGVIVLWFWQFDLEPRERLLLVMSVGYVLSPYLTPYRLLVYFVAMAGYLVSRHKWTWAAILLIGATPLTKLFINDTAYLLEYMSLVACFALFVGTLLYRYGTGVLFHQQQIRGNVRTSIRPHNQRSR